MAFRFIVVCFIVFVAAAPRADAQTAFPPKGGANFFGAPQNQAFTPDTAFQGLPPRKAPAPTPPPLAPPLVIPDSPDGGLLPLIPPPAPPPKIWAGSADVGLNGATGNSELFNFRTNLNAVRKTPTNILTTDFLYQFTQQDGNTSTNQALLNARDEVLFRGSPWGAFGSVNLEYDELREFDFRVGVYAGLGYTVVDRKELMFKVRAGAGAVREIVTRDQPITTDPLALTAPPTADRWTPEFVFGYDFRYVLNDRSALLSVLDYYPRVDDFSQFRVRMRAAYEFVLDPQTCTILRLGVQDRYDSDPGLSNKNDLSYFATLGFKY